MSWLRFLGPIRLRRRWGECLAAALLVGLILGVALFAVAGARRTQSSYDRYLRSVDSSDVSISQDGFDPAHNAEIAALPGVTSTRTYLGMRIVVLENGVVDPIQFSEGVASYDGAFFDRDRFAATQGRIPDPASVGEVAFNDVAARRYGYHVGQHLDIGVVPESALDDAQPSITHTTPVVIVGIGSFPDELIVDDSDAGPRMLLTPAFTATAIDAAFYNLQYLRLDNVSTDIEAVRKHLAAFTQPGRVDIHYVEIDRANARRGLRPLSTTLIVLGIIAAGVGAALAVMALSRIRRREAVDADILQALGASPRAIQAALLIGPAVAFLGMLVVAVIVGVALSPLMPLGPVRAFEGQGVLDIDVEVIGLGSIALLLLAGAAAAATIVWHTRSRTHAQATRRSSRPAQSVLFASGSAAFTTGIRLSFGRGHTRRGVPMRPVIAGTALAVATLIVAIGFGTNLTALTHDPHLYGWNWDIALREGQGFGQLDVASTASILNADREIAAWSTAYVGDDLVDGVDLPLLGMSPSADVRPALLSGRFIVNSSEIDLGAASADRLHAHIGDTVTIGSPDKTQELRVVGIATLPSIGGEHVLHPSLGLGAVVAPELIPGVVDQSQNSVGPALAFIQLRQSTDVTAEAQHLTETTAPLGVNGDLDVLTAQRPSEIVNAATLGNTPLLVAAAFAGIAVIAFVVALVASARRNSRDLAVLRTLGFSDRQMTSTILWHAYAISVTGLLAGLPIGVVGSARLWTIYAEHLNVIDVDHIPARMMSIVAAATIVITGVAASAPALIAARTSPATKLRTD